MFQHHLLYQSQGCSGVVGVCEPLLCPKLVRELVEGSAARVHLEAAAGLSSTGSTSQVPSGAIWFTVERVSTRGHQVGDCMQPDEGTVGLLWGDRSRDPRTTAPAFYFVHIGSKSRWKCSHVISGCGSTSVCPRWGCLLQSGASQKRSFHLSTSSASNPSGSQDRTVGLPAHCVFPEPQKMPALLLDRRASEPAVLKVQCGLF